MDSDGGGAGADAKVVVAYGGTVKVSGDLALTGGQGGLGGGLGGSALLSVQHGGQIEVGTDAVLVSGDGGDGHPNATDGGNGGSFIPLFLRMSGDSETCCGVCAGAGVSGLLIVEAGSVTVTVKRDAVFTSGRGGNGNQGGSSRTSYLAAVRSLTTSCVSWSCVLTEGSWCRRRPAMSERGPPRAHSRVRCRLRSAAICGG